MRIIFIILLVQIMCSLTVLSFADEKSDCLNNCSNEKRSNEMYCPPAGGYTDEEHKQCLNKNTAAYSDCTKGCSPSPAPSPSPTPQEQQPAALEPPAQSRGPGATDKQ